MSRATRSHLPARPWTVIGIVLLLVMPRGPSAASLSRYVVALEAEASTGAHTEPPIWAGVGSMSFIGDCRTDRAGLCAHYSGLASAAVGCRGSQSRAGCLVARPEETAVSQMTSCLALRRELAGVSAVSRMTHPCGNLHRTGHVGHPVVGTAAGLRAFP